jgi:hypothetical protein
MLPRGILAALIAFFLAGQILAPLWYYVRGGNDERFAWRMFSSQSVRRCQVHVSDILSSGQGIDSERPVNLLTALHPRWTGLLARGNHRVVEAFLQTRCRIASVNAVRFRRNCTDVDGSELPPDGQQTQCSTALPARSM